MWVTLDKQRWVILAERRGQGSGGQTLIIAICLTGEDEGVDNGTMARPLRIQYPGAIYHVTSRGNERKDLFQDDADREMMRRKLAASLRRCQVRLYAYVLMRNHLHLLVETPQANLSRFMQHFSTAYTVYYNRRHQRQGHLLEGRFKARLVEGSRYLLQLTRYLHLNPVKIKRVSRLAMAEKVELLRQYRWSNYRGYAGLGEKEAFVDYGPLGGLLGEGKKDRKRASREFIEGGLAGRDEELAEVMGLSTKAIGGQAFCGWVEEEQHRRLEQFQAPEETWMRRREVRVDPEFIMKTVRQVCGMEEVELQRFHSRHGGAATGNEVAGGTGGVDRAGGGEADGSRQHGGGEPALEGSGG
jgi:REP element-mobilizing transposase RayT